MERIKLFFRNFLSNNAKIKYYRKKGVKIGDNCRLFSSNFGSEPYLISIGNHVTITEGVRFITHDGAIWVLRENEYPNGDILEPIKIGDNCFIGLNSIILPGVTIGNNVIVGAGSIVTQSIPDSSIVAGVPARIIKNVDEYSKQIKSKVEYTKDMTYETKKAFYLKKFNTGSRSNG